MRLKRVSALVVILVLMMTGCVDIESQVSYLPTVDEEPESDYNEYDEYYGLEEEEPETADYEDIADYYSEESTEDEGSSESYNSVSIDFQNIEFEYSDENGYKYKATIKISPWILRSNTDAIQSAWNEVGKDNYLPSIHDFGLDEESNNLMRANYSWSLHSAYSATVTDMYFAVGQIEIRNVTNNWSFSDDNPGGSKVYYDWRTNVNSGVVGLTRVVSKVFYGSKEKDFGGIFTVEPSMTSDNWGPVSFVIAHAENFSPNHPEGEYRGELENGALYKYSMPDLSPESADVIKIPIYE